MLNICLKCLNSRQYIQYVHTSKWFQIGIEVAGRLTGWLVSWLSPRLSVCLSVRPSVRPSACLSVCPSACLSVCPSVRLSVRPPVCLSVSSSDWQASSCWLAGWIWLPSFGWLRWLSLVKNTPISTEIAHFEAQSNTPFLSKKRFFRNINWGTLFVKARIYVTASNSRHFYVCRIFYYF